MKIERIIFGVMLTLSMCIYAYAESCSSVGSTEVKYSASGCSYSTSKRTCCSNKTWSDWDKACPTTPTCGANECWNGSSCAAKEETSRNCSGNVANAVSGNQTRTATCNSGSGWSYGSWTGTCTCKSGYSWTVSRCLKELEPSLTYSWGGSIHGGPACNNTNYCVTDFSRCPECNASRVTHVCAVQSDCGWDGVNCSFYYYTCYEGGATIGGGGIIKP